MFHKSLSFLIYRNHKTKNTMKQIPIKSIAVLSALAYFWCTDVKAFATAGYTRPAFRTSPSAAKPTFSVHATRLSLVESATLERTEIEDKTSSINANMTDSHSSDMVTPLNEMAPLKPFEAIEGENGTFESKLLELTGLGAWITGLSCFLLANNYLGPWPANLLQSIPVEYFGLTHALAGMLFGGGIILTTLIEWLASASKNASVLKFWFGKVPALDSFVVLPALTASIVSGVGLAVDHYESLGQAPIHVVTAISTLLTFAGWWAATDLTTQSAANEAVIEWTQGDTENTSIPRIVQLRKISNVVSCIFVAAIYAIMVLKPGYSP